jgi:hypothetical protein
VTDTRDYKYSVWHTQGGGLVREVGDKFIFVEAPDSCYGLDVGDDMPAEWGIHPANDLAQAEMERDDPLACHQDTFADHIGQLCSVL